MKASELFGVAVRTIGLFILLYGLYDIWGGIDTMLSNLLPDSSDSESASALSYFVFGVPEFIVGTLFFFLADAVVKLAYRDHS